MRKLMIALGIVLMSTGLKADPAVVALVPGAYVDGYGGFEFEGLQPAIVTKGYSDGLLHWKILVYSLVDHHKEGEFNFTYGLDTDVVVPAARDYDGDGYDDPAVFRPSNDTWYVLKAYCGPEETLRWACSVTFN